MKPLHWALLFLLLVLLVAFLTMRRFDLAAVPILGLVGTWLSKKTSERRKVVGAEIIPLENRKASAEKNATDAEKDAGDAGVRADLISEKRDTERVAETDEELASRFNRDHGLRDPGDGASGA